MMDPSDISRRELIVGGGLTVFGAVGIGAATIWNREDRATVRSGDDRTSVHRSDDFTPSQTDVHSRDEPTDDGSSSKPPDDDIQKSVEITFPKKDLDRANSDSVTFFHDGFVVCNRGEQKVSIWIDSDAIENEKSEPSVVFYRDGNLGDRIDDPEHSVTLDVGECVQVGYMLRTFGIAADTRLLETIYVRSS